MQLLFHRSATMTPYSWPNFVCSPAGVCYDWVSCSVSGLWITKLSRPEEFTPMLLIHGASQANPQRIVPRAPIQILMWLLNLMGVLPQKGPFYSLH